MRSHRSSISVNTSITIATTWGMEETSVLPGALPTSSLDQVPRKSIGLKIRRPEPVTTSGQDRLLAISSPQFLGTGRVHSLEPLVV
jgi:hypothetical protein